MYEIVVLEDAEKFIRQLDIKMRAKVVRTISLLQEFGPALPMPHSKKLKGAELSELRIKFSSNIVRMFYFHFEDKVYVVTSGFIKKKDKTDKNEIEKALRLKNFFLEEGEDAKG